MEESEHMARRPRLMVRDADGRPQEEVLHRDGYLKRDPNQNKNKEQEQQRQILRPSLFSSSLRCGCEMRSFVPCLFVRNVLQKMGTWVLQGAIHKIHKSEHLKNPSVGEKINYKIHAMDYNSAFKRKDILPHTPT